MKLTRLLATSALILAVAGTTVFLQGQASAPAAFTPVAVTMTIDASKSSGPMNPIWRWDGYDEPNYTYAPNGKKLVNQFTGDKNSPFGPAYFRAHSLLVTGDGKGRPKWGSTNAYTEDAAGNPVYSWTIIDKIFDTYIEAGAKPFVQIGFMPKALSLRPEPYEHTWKPGDQYGNIYTGWTSPPNNYDKWRELNFQWAKHCVEKYGMEEVKKWYWEVWNEPNIGYLSPSVRSTAATAAERNAEDARTKTIDYEKIWDYAADGIRKAIPDAIISGAETAGDGGAFQRDFIEHCINGTNYATGKKGSPLGMISFHAKGSMGDTAGFRQRGFVRMGVAAQLATINAGFRIVAARPETAKLPIVIGESDPDGCAACQAYNGLYPENGYRNGSIFAAYTIEQLTRTLDLAERNNVNIKGSVNWAFEFEEAPLFAGFRALATDGIALPVLNTYRMLNKMGTRRLTVNSTGDLGLNRILAPLNQGGGVRGPNSDVMALASRDDKRLTILAWNYHDDEVPGPLADITINLSGLPGEITAAKMTQWRIDETHSNAHTAWKKIGSPAKPTEGQRQEIEAASELAMTQKPADQPIADGKTAVKVSVPRQGLCLIELAW